MIKFFFPTVIKSGTIFSPTPRGIPVYPGYPFSYAALWALFYVFPSCRNWERNLERSWGALEPAGRPGGSWEGQVRDSYGAAAKKKKKGENKKNVRIKLSRFFFGVLHAVKGN